MMRFDGSFLVGGVVAAIAGGTAIGWFVMAPQAAVASSGPPAQRTPPRSTSAPPSTTPTSTAAARSAVRRNWMAFFSSSTSLVAKEHLLEDGRRLAGALRSLSSSPLARHASAAVSGVVVHGHQAAVSYSLLVNGQPALAHRHGTAVRKDGRWLVTAGSFCGLVALEGEHPSACAAVGKAGAG